MKNKETPEIAKLLLQQFSSKLERGMPQLYSIILTILTKLINDENLTAVDMIQLHSIAAVDDYPCFQSAIEIHARFINSDQTSQTTMNEQEKEFYLQMILRRAWYTSEYFILT